MNPLNNIVATANDSCGICLENFKFKGTAIQAGCRHVFHAHCIEGWTTTCVDKRNKALAVAREHLAIFERNGRRGQLPRDHIPNAGSCPMCREPLSREVTPVKIQAKITTNETELSNTQDDLSKNIAEALVLRNFSKVKILTQNNKFYLDKDLIIIILKQEIQNNNQENIKEMLSIIKCVSVTAATSLNIALTDIINTLLKNKNIEVAQILINHIQNK